jgi:hypothetical protein
MQCNVMQCNARSEQLEQREIGERVVSMCSVYNTGTAQKRKGSAYIIQIFFMIKSCPG